MHRRSSGAQDLLPADAGPVARCQRENGDHHVEIRSVGEWFDLDETDTPGIVRDAFRLLWEELRRHFPDAVVLGSPSQTGRDLWTRTIPRRGKHADGFPVLSEDLRGLLHATAGQGRNELLTPPRIPQQLPALIEYDRTFAYAKHTWKSPAGAPRRVNGKAFASWSAKEQRDALYGCGHWHIRVTTVSCGLPTDAIGARPWPDIGWSECPRSDPCCTRQGPHTSAAIQRCRRTGKMRGPDLGDPASG